LDELQAELALRAELESVGWGCSETNCTTDVGYAEMLCPRPGRKATSPGIASCGRNGTDIMRVVPASMTGNRRQRLEQVRRHTLSPVLVDKI